MASMSTTTTTTKISHWLAGDVVDDTTTTTKIDCLCLGTGRFLRSVLIPPLVSCGYHPALIQTRGRSFMDYMNDNNNIIKEDDNCYEIDTVLPTGKIETSKVKCYGAFSLGHESTTKAFWDILPKIVSSKTGITMIGIGVTEAGLSSYDTTAMKNLFEILEYVCNQRKNGIWPTTTTNNSKLVVIDMDNVPNNGDIIRNYMIQHCQETNNNIEMLQFINEQVVFLNTMVDRITSQRDGSNGLVPRCEPIPAKALVVLDPNNDWKKHIDDDDDDDGGNKNNNKYGVVIRSTKEQLNVDIALKLRIANGTHTAIAHALALEGFLQTNILSDDTTGKIFMTYLDILVEKQIVPGCNQLCSESSDAASEVYDDWRKRLIHPAFGLSSFFITQNGPAKGGIRWGPTIVDLIKQDIPIQISFAFAYAVLLRWLTPVEDQSFHTDNTDSNSVYTGWLEKFGINNNKKPTLAGIVKNDDDDGSTTMYADGLRYNLQQGWYEYKCPVVVVDVDTTKQPLVKLLQESVRLKKPADACLQSAIRGYLFASDGGDLSSCSKATAAIDDLVQAIAILYTRLIAGDGLMNMLRELEASKDGIGLESPCRALTVSETS